ncbi:hypothetical protein JHK84_027982 [Glycine max]|nr:hypothetical protein JHK85_028388 [Glycine max]KAG5151510.1 hypothetical protein JHK84_027982 [Glycine max]
MPSCHRKLRPVLTVATYNSTSVSSFDSTIITPRVEGTLQILGVRWKLSGTIVGFHNFELCHPKKIIKGRRKTKHMPNEKFKFMVIKIILNLQGPIHPLPGKAYAGDLQQQKVSSGIKIPMAGPGCPVSDHPPHLSAEALE